MHLGEGEIRAFIDQETSPEESARYAAHLERCERCQSQFSSLQKNSRQVAGLLEELDPTIKPLLPSIARAQLSSRLEEANRKESIGMWNKLTTRIPRQAWVALAVVTILAISLAFAPVRAIASSFLGLFRVQQIQVIEFNPEELSDQLDASSQYANLLGENIEVEALGETEQVNSAAEASSLAGFDVRLPGIFDQQPQLSVEPGGSATFNVDLDLVNAVLQDMGFDDIELPRELDGASVVINVPTAVVAEYGNCGYDLSSNPEHAATPPPRTLNDCTTLIQMPSPTISAPPELDIAQIGQAYLQILGMDEAEAAQFARTVDWTTTFIVPIPRYETDYRDVQVGDVTGTLIYREQGYAPFYILLWVEDDIVHALRGPGDWSSAIEIATSLR